MRLDSIDILKSIIYFSAIVMQECRSNKFESGENVSWIRWWHFAVGARVVLQLA